MNICKSPSLSMILFQKLLKDPIISYYCCENINDYTEEDNAKRNENEQNVKELLLLTSNNLLFLRKNEVKRSIYLLNIAKLSLKLQVTTIHLIQSIENNQNCFDFIIHDQNSFIKLLSTQYSGCFLLKEGRVNKLQLELDVNKENFKTTLISKMKSKFGEENISNVNSNNLKGYCFETAKYIIQDKVQNSLFRWKRNSKQKQTFFKIIIHRKKANEILIANKNKCNFKSHSLAKLNRYLKIFYSDYTEFVLISIKKIRKTEKLTRGKWSIWEFSLKGQKTKTTKINLIYTFLRRQCIPPLFESYQDIIVLLEEKIIDSYALCNVQKKTKQAYDLIIQSLKPENQETENSISKLLVFHKIASHLVDSFTLQYLYHMFLSKNTEFKSFLSLFKFSNDINYKVLLIKEQFEKTHDIIDMKKRCLNFWNECQTPSNLINVDNYSKQMQYCSFQDIIDNELKIINHYFASTSSKSKSSVIWKNKILNTLEFAFSDTFAGTLFEELIDFAKRVSPSFIELSNVFNSCINFQALNIEDELLFEVNISSIMSNVSSIKEIYYNEHFLILFIQKNILKTIQGIESDLIYFQFLNYILENNLSFHLFKAIYLFLSHIAKNLVSSNYQEELAFENNPMKKYSNIFLITFINIYRTYSQSVDFIILATKCLIMIASINPINKKELLKSDVCYYLNWYLNSFDKNLVYYSVLLFKELTESNFDIRTIVEKHSTIIIKMINIIKGSKISDCSFHPQTLLTVLDSFGYLLQNNQVKEFLCDYSRRKWLKYLLKIIANPKTYVGHYIEYYLMILIAVYEILTIIVKKNTDIRLFLQTEFHLLKLIDLKCKQYMQFSKGDLNYKELLLETIMDFMKEFVGNDLTMQQYARMNGKNIIEYSLRLNNNNITKILYPF